MNILIKQRPEVGDIMIIVDGERRFVRGSECTKEFIDTQDAVGVVFFVQGNRFWIVGGVNNQTKRFSAVADYEITAIPSASGDYAVILNDVAQGDFTYTKSDGTLSEFVTQLDAWLKSRPAGSKALKWEAYMNSEKAYLQMSTYNEYEGTVTIAGTSLTKLIATELPLNSSNRNQIKQRTTYAGLCRPRVESFAKNQTGASSNPTTVMDGVTKLYETYPCSEIYYNGENGTGLRANFSTYSAYIDACMLLDRELDYGAAQYRDGQYYTSLLNKQVLINGTPTPAYSAADYCANYDSGVSGYGAGTFWMPSVYEGAQLMRNIGGTNDLVNTALGKKTGWGSISSTSNRWLCGRAYPYFAWTYFSSGVLGNTYFYSSFYVSAVSAFNIND